MLQVRVCVLLAMLVNSIGHLQATELRVATFNVSIEAGNYISREELADDPSRSTIVQQHLASGANKQIQNIAEIIQRVRPDVILLNEFDYNENVKQSLAAFQKNYLAVSQNSKGAIQYPYSYSAPVNTGVASPYDLDGDGNKSGIAGDAYGFGYYPGQYGMAVFSKYPIIEDQIRTFQNFLWHDMPKALKPLDLAGKSWYSDEAWRAIRLSSKSHWDIPIDVNGQRLHVLAAHPTPPIFDGDEDRNGRRNHDEIRLIADYLSDQAYIYDDAGEHGGLATNTRFVILGDLNASADEGKAITSGINSLLHNDMIDASCVPTSEGGKQSRIDNEFAAQHTAAWGLRVDYVLPSEFGVESTDCGVFWPLETSKDRELVADRASSSDHRLVWMDLKIVEP